MTQPGPAVVLGPSQWCGPSGTRTYIRAPARRWPPDSKSHLAPGAAGGLLGPRAPEGPLGRMGAAHPVWLPEARPVEQSCATEAQPSGGTKDPKVLNQGSESAGTLIRAPPGFPEMQGH